MTGQALIVQGDALHLPLPDGSVDLIVTSPPYWALRAYGAGHGEIGSEPTPQAYLEALWAATAEMMRVLKPTGSAFVDLGDKYVSRQDGWGATDGGSWAKIHKHTGDTRENGKPIDVGDRSKSGEMARRTGIPNKSLMLLPERYRIGCVDHLGLIARAVICWNKPNGLPESVTDRVRRSHEDWVHLVRSPRYYSATDEIREPHTGHTGNDSRPARNSHSGTNHRALARDESLFNPLGKLPGSVWSIPSEPLRLPDHLGVQHYAAFPSEWPRRLILGWSPPGVCVECGQGRVPVVERQRGFTEGRCNGCGRPQGQHHQSNRSSLRNADGHVLDHGGSSLLDDGTVPCGAATILGYACSCTPFTDHPGTGGTSQQDVPRQDGHDRQATKIREVSPNNRPGLVELHDYQRVGPWREYHLEGWQAPPTRPAVVLDPFSGVGTTIGVARRLGRVGVGVDLSGPYCRAAKWRVNDADQFGKAVSRMWNERQGQLL